MPRVETKRKIRLGAERHCGRCGKKIENGENYRQWSFRYGGTHFRCYRPECTPRRSELTQSKMGEVYAAIEDAESTISGAESIDDITTAIEEVAERARDVAAEYEEAAEHFGGEGENRERADEVEAFADELDNFYPDEEAEISDVREEAEGLLTECAL